MSEDRLRMEFNSLIGKEPYPHQIKTAKALLEGKSVILRAPTGSGKSEAVIFPFLLGRKKSLPHQLIYSLPLRSLVESLGERFQKYDRSVTVHHGQRPEAALFSPEILVTTIDQTVGAYACTPLSLPIRYGNIPAGAVSSALLAFDEVHLLDPLLGFQSALIIAQHSAKLCAPFVFLSATLPSKLVDWLQNEFKDKGKGIEIIDCKEKDVPVRQNRRVTIDWKSSPLTAEEVRNLFANNSSKMLVVCNTVVKAQEIYRDLTDNPPCKVELLHSRFLPQDRSEKEKRIREQLFGKEANKDPVILVATQVIEAGLDISARLTLSELAPIDSLIQRAGRCARWGGEGKVLIYEVGKAAPYQKELTAQTRTLLKANSGAPLDWETEKKWVDEVMDKEVEKNMDDYSRSHVLNLLSEAAFSGQPHYASEAVRGKELLCGVSIYNHERCQPKDAGLLEMIKVPWTVLRKAVKDEKIQLYELVDENILDDEVNDTSWRWRVVDDPDEIRPGGFYLIETSQAFYNSDLGLLLGELGETSFSFRTRKPTEELNKEYHKETWFEHSQNTLNAFRKHLHRDYKWAIEHYAQAWNLETTMFAELIETMLLLHDIGKLNKRWQDEIGWDGNQPLAKSENGKKGRLPSHATVSARALEEVFFKLSQKKKLTEAICYAIAHHHSIKAHRFTSFKFVKKWKDQLLRLGFDELIELVKYEAQGNELLRFPELKEPKTYRTYAFLSRILRFSDWIASKGDHDAVLCFEERYRTL